MTNNISEKIKRTALTLLGFVCLLLGAIFILLPGPAVLFIPLGLALLSLEFDWAKIWLKFGSKKAKVIFVEPLLRQTKRCIG